MSKRIIAEIVVAIVVLAIGFGLGTLDGGQSLGATAYDNLYQVGNLYQGMANILEFTNGQFVGETLVNGTTTFNSVTLGAYQNDTSSFYGTLTVNLGTTGSNIAVGGACNVSLSTFPTSTAFGADAFVKSVGATTSSVAYSIWNGTPTAVTVATGTIGAYCYH